jgi:metallo-beta-lactamase family protein
MVRLTFYGAAETVTGSKYLVEAGKARVMIDCGLFQGRKELRELNWAKPQYDTASIDAVVLTHAHLDHTGYLPRLVKEGYRGPIHCTPATRELAELILLDSARLQEQDAEYANRKGYSKHKPALPLYDEQDAKLALKRFRNIDRDEWKQIEGPIWVRLHDTGHLLGSGTIEMEIRDQTPPLRILFSGDVGRYDAPLYHDPQPPTQCDYLVCESTYGNRDHGTANLLDELAEVVNRAVRRGGVILMAAFAIGRAQQLTYLLQLLMFDGKIPPLPIHIDSPMAVDATEIYRKYSADHDLCEGQLTGPGSVLGGRHVHFSQTVNQSKALNAINSPAVIISSSGMMTGGRILHHLKQRLGNERNTILLGGFQAEGTRGRDLEDGAPFIRMHGREVAVKAAIERVSGLSGHADRGELLRWLAKMPAPRQTFLTHGEKDASEAFAANLRDERHWAVTVPKLGEAFELT